MNKAFVDDMIRGMKLASIVTKAAPWSFEGSTPAGAKLFDDVASQQKSVRYVGLALKEEWLDIFSSEDNVLLKFVIDRSSAYLEYYVANKPPFVKIFVNKFDNNSKWEHLLGELKRRLKKDKEDFINHRDSVGNLYARIKPHLK